LPVFTEFGFTVLDVIGPALSSLTQTLTNVFRDINNLSRGFGELIASGSLVAPIIIGLVSLLGGPLSLALGGIIGLFVGFNRALDSNFANLRQYFGGLSRQVRNVLPAARQAFNAFLDGVDVSRLTASLQEFEQALGTQLLATLEALKPVFGDLRTLLRENEDEFEEIGEAVGTLFVGALELATAFVNVLYPALRNFVIPAIRAGIDALDFLIDKLARTIELTQAIEAGNFGEATDIALQATDQQAEARRFTQELAANQRRQEEFNQIVEVKVEGDTGLVRQVSAEVIDEQSRQQRRNNGTPTGL
jgi:phage-related protein